ncbi:MAG: DUF4432 family protein [Planctomycetota bacterium]|nr:MAG: DUF4432 family protein [Planctomycetota bacterium]
MLGALMIRGERECDAGVGLRNWRGMLSVLCGALLAILLSDSAAAEPMRYVLTSVESNVHAGDFALTSDDVGAGGDVDWSVRRVTLHGGRQEGVDLLIVDNGVLVVKLIPTRGMSLLDVRAGDVRLGWDSPVKEVVHPQFINLESRGGLGWLEGFNEWMVRCGLEWAGHPGLDQFIDNTGAAAEMELTLHGKVGNIPASEVEVLIDGEAPHRIRVRGVVHERTFFGPKLELVTEFSIVPGESAFRIEDRVLNRGATAQEMQLIYHTNYGAPLLEKGARLVTAASEVAPMNETAISGLDEYSVYAGPTPGYIEQVYLFKPLADAEGQCAVLLKNAAGDRGSSITWSIAELPYLTVWKNTSAEEDGYVTGLEPATGYPYHRSVERAWERLPVLEGGESRTFGLTFAVHPDAESVREMEERIGAMQGDTEIRVLESPPPEEPE